MIYARYPSNSVHMLPFPTDYRNLVAIAFKRWWIFDDRFNANL